MKLTILGPIKGVKTAFVIIRKGQNKCWLLIYIFRLILKIFSLQGQLLGLLLLLYESQYQQGCPQRSRGCAQRLPTKMDWQYMFFIINFQGPPSYILLGLVIKAKAFSHPETLSLMKTLEFPTFYFCKWLFGWIPEYFAKDVVVRNQNPMS